MFDHDAMAKISKLPWSNGQNWSILTIDNGKNRGSGVMVNFLTIDHGVNSSVTWSWSWSVTIKSDCSLFKRSDEIEEWIHSQVCRSFFK